MLEIIDKEKILIVFDRGYPSIEFFHWLEKRYKIFNEIAGKGL